jgi:2-amino-4-hydroxy-6-hydroxymethyldihydropteridine diphosphokinase
VSSAGLRRPAPQRRLAEPQGRAPLADEAWLGFGSNLGDRLGNIERALEFFSDTLVEISPIFETSPWGLVDQPWFLNGVARLKWSGSAQHLLAACLRCEQRSGRVRGERNGPRIIDLDVLVAGTVRCDGEGLTLPHPGLASRRSVLEPWALLAPELRLPGYECTLLQLRQRSLSLVDQSVRAFTP